MTTYESAKDDPKQAIGVLAMMLLAHSEGFAIPDCRLEKAIYLIGTVANGLGMTLDETRSAMRKAILPMDMVDAWYTDRIIAEEVRS